MNTLEQIKTDFDQIARLSPSNERVWDNNNHYFKLVKKIVPVKMSSLLEIGCGKGEFCNFIEPNVTGTIHGIDVSPEMIKSAESNRRSDKIRYENGDFFTSTALNNTYDAIVTFATAHHMDLKKLTTAVKELLNPGGYFINIDLYHLENIIDYWYSLLGVFVNKFYQYKNGEHLSSLKHENGLKQAWHNHMAHDHYLSIKEIKKIARQSFDTFKIKRLCLWRYLLIWRKG